MTDQTEQYTLDSEADSSFTTKSEPMIPIIVASGKDLTSGEFNLTAGKFFKPSVNSMVRRKSRQEDNFKDRKKVETSTESKRSSVLSL